MASLLETVLRADDFLHCEFEFVNLVLGTSAAGVPQLTRAAAGPAFIVLRLPPQSVTEQVLPSSGSVLPLPLKAGLAGPSRLTFRLSDTPMAIDYRLDALLAAVDGAELVAADTLAAGRQATAIECPDRLLLVPRSSVRLTHRTRPVASPRTGVTELWHTTLRDAARDATGQFRAIDNPSDTAAAARPFDASLTAANRGDIVRHSRQAGADPHVIASSLFRLTALGATAKLQSAWRPDPNVSLAAWEQRVELGRDRYAYTLEQGYLFPFGHRATIATITQRTLTPHIGVQAAVLQQSRVLTILDAERSYSDLAALYPGSGREMPFVRARIASAPQRIDAEAAPLRVDLVLTDRAGNPVDCSATVLFVPAGAAATSQATLAELRQRYDALSVVSLGGQRVAMADDDGGRGDTGLNVDAMTFGVKLPSDLRGGAIPAFLPFMRAADARIPGLEHLVGTTAGATDAARRRATAITFHETYLETGFRPQDPKQVWARFAAIPGISIPAERAGGLAAPTFPAVDGLSRLTGPLSDVEGFAAGRMLTPEALVGDTKLLGVIPLKDIITAATDGADPFPVADIRELFGKVDEIGRNFLPRPVMTTVAGPSGVETRFVWKPRIKSTNLPRPLEGDAMELVLKGRITTSVRSASSPPAFTVEGKLRNFALSFGLLAVRFNAVEFVSEAERKVGVKLDVAGIDFRGMLTFVRKLQEVLPTGALGRGALVQVQRDGVMVRYAIPLPAIPLGALSIQNIVLSSSISLPFVEGKPAAVRFALSERHDPFQITVSIFGGTGFFAIEVMTDKTVLVEAALEFGGIAALNLVVVKGGVHLLAGVYLSMRPGLVIEGHLRLGGFVDLLGIVTVSIDFYLALTYVEDLNVLYGTGRLTIGVKLLFFSESFSFTIQKRIPGFGEGPVEGVPVASLALGPRPGAALHRPDISAGQWERYCRAFA